MEPVSLAVGIVPLAISVIELSSAFRDKVATYKSAETDIQSIGDRMILIIEICNYLQDEKNKPHHHLGAGIRDRALGMCYGSVLSIQKELKKVVEKGRGRRQNLEWLLRKSNIDRLSHGLNDSISMLNTYMNWSVLTSSRFQTELTTSQELSLEPYHASKSAPVSNQAISTWPRRPTTVTTRRSTYESSLYIYTTLETSKVEECHLGESQYRSYLFGLPFLGTYMNLATRWGPMSPLSISLSTPRFIYEEKDKSIYDEIILYGLDDLDKCGSTPLAMAKWLQEHKISADTQLVSKGHNDGSGRRSPFFGAMIANNNTSIVKYLIEQGGQALEYEEHFVDLQSILIRDTELDAKSLSSDSACIYARMRGPMLTMEEYTQLVTISESVRYIEIIFEICKDYFCEEWGDFLDTTFLAVVKLYVNWPDCIWPQNCSSLISTLLTAGLNINKPLDPDFNRSTRRHFKSNTSFLPSLETALQQILDQSRQPIECLDAAEEWLKTLEGASVQTSEYLEAELEAQLQKQRTESTFQVRPDDWDRMSSNTKLERIYNLLKPGQRVSLEGEISDDLRKAMPSFQYMDVRIFMLSPNNPRHQEPSHLTWKMQRLEEIMSRSWESIPWPFVKDTWTLITDQRGFKNMTDWSIKALAAYDYFIQLINERAERRQSRKWAKLKKRNGMMTGSKSMPGAWEMEWWEYRGGW